MASSVQHTPADADAPQTLERWLTQHATVMIGALGLTAAARTGAWLAVAAVLSFARLYLCTDKTPGRIRPADVMTTARLAALVAAAAALPHLAPLWALAAFAFNVAVDSLDGCVARARGEATRLGAVFDREADAFFVLVAYTYLHWQGLAGGWVLVLGALPYLYRLLVVATAAARPPDHKERLAAPLAAANFVLLLTAAAFPRHARPIVAVSALVLVVSFGGSLWNLGRHAYSRRQ